MAQNTKSSRGSRNGSPGGRQSSQRASNSSSPQSKDTQQLEGRAPSDEPDVFIDIPKVKVDEISLEVERLQAHLALQTKLANLLQLVAGAHVSIDTVKLDIKGVEAEAMLKVRLENVYDILDRALATIDRNPEILEHVLDTADSAVQTTGKAADDAIRPGGALSNTLGSVGDSLGQLTSGLGDSAGQLVHGVGDSLGQLGKKSPSGSSNGKRRALIPGLTAVGVGLAGGVAYVARDRRGGLKGLLPG